MAVGNIFASTAVNDAASKKRTQQEQEQAIANAQARVDDKWAQQQAEEEWARKQEEKKRKEAEEDRKAITGSASAPEPEPQPQQTTTTTKQPNQAAKDRIAAQKAADIQAAQKDATNYSWTSYATNPVNNVQNEAVKAEAQRIQEQQAAQKAAEEAALRAQEEAARKAEALRQEQLAARRRAEEQARQEIAQRQASANTALEQGSTSVNSPVTTTTSTSAGYLPYGDPRTNNPVNTTTQTGMSPEQEAWLASQEGQAAYANQLAREANDAYFTEQARRLPEAYQLQGLRGGRTPVISSNTDTQYVDDFNQAYRLALAQGSKGADARAFAFDVADTQREKRNSMSMNTGTTTDEDEFYTDMYIPELEEDVPLIKNTEGDGLDNILGPLEDRIAAQNMYQSRVDNAIANTPEQYRQGYEYDYPAKIGMGLINRWNALAYQNDVEDQRLDWITSQPEYLNAKTDAEKIAAMRKLITKYDMLVEQGDITLPEAKPIVTSNQVRDKIDAFFEGASPEAIRSRDEANALYQDALKAAAQAGINPNNPEGAKFIADYIAVRNKEIVPDENPFGVETGTGSSGSSGGKNDSVNTRSYTANPFVQTSTGDLALEASIRRGDTTYEQVYDDYVAKHKDAIGEDDARRLAYQRIYDLGYRPDISDPKSYEHYTTGMSKDFIDKFEKATGNDYYTGGASYMDRYINQLAGGFDRSYEQDRDFYDLTSELAGNAGRNNPLTGEPYATTPGYSGDENYPQNAAMQAAMNGNLTTDQILHFFDSNYSDIVIPPETQRWMADNSTRSLSQFFINSGRNQDRLQKEQGTDAEFYEALRALVNANPNLQLLHDKGRLSMDDIANQFMKAPVDASGEARNPLASNSTSNSPHPGYYEWNGKLYPIDQEKAKYYLKYGTYNGWDEGMRDYYNTFGTFAGYRPDWRKAGQVSPSGSTYSGNKSYSYSGGSSTGGTSTRTYSNGYYYNSGTNTYGNKTNRATATPSTANQRQNRIYNIMKNWSF